MNPSRLTDKPSPVAPLPPHPIDTSCLLRPTYLRNPNPQGIKTNWEMKRYLLFYISVIFSDKCRKNLRFLGPKSIRISE
jgi:hypothetical protein